MNEFDYEVLQKKRIAQSAKYRKNGSKSKKCSMSTDYMTEKEWKERNGKIVSYYMNKPMSWGEFKNLPFEAQRNYLSGLIEKYGVNSANLSEMFGVSSQAIRRHLNSNDVGIKFPVGHSLTNKERELWREFITPEEQSDKHEVADTNPSEDNYDDQRADEDSKECEAGDVVETACEGMNMDTFTIKFSGSLDPTSIYHSLLMMLGKNSIGELEIVYNREGL